MVVIVPKEGGSGSLTPPRVPLAGRRVRQLLLASGRGRSRLPPCRCEVTPVFLSYEVLARTGETSALPRLFVFDVAKLQGLKRPRNTRF